MLEVQSNFFYMGKFHIGECFCKIFPNKGTIAKHLQRGKHIFFFLLYSPINGEQIEANMKEIGN